MSAALFSTSAFAAGTASVSGGKITFTAGAGDVNNVTYRSIVSTGVEINDVLPITPGTGCSAIDSDSVLCGHWASQLVLNLGDGDDLSTDTSFLGGSTINGGDGNDNLTGGSTIDKINGDAGDDAIYGEYNNDQLNGGLGSDDIYGGDGNDVIDGGLGADDFQPGAGSDTLTYASRTANLTIDVGGSSGEPGESDVIQTGDSFEVYTLGSGNDTFYGAWNGVPFTVNGGNGVDTLNGSNGNDVLNGGGGNDFYRGYSGDDTLSAYGNDDIRGDGGFDTATFATQPYSNTVTVDDVANDGGGGTGGTGNVRTDIERVVGSNYIDTITGQATASTVIDGGTGSDTLNGGSAADTISGGSGDDSINPGSGSDSVVGGSGADTMTINDGVADTADCGTDPSTDKVHADTGLDTLTGTCESVWWY